MRKLTLITMLFVLFLGIRCQALESAKAAFFGKHECHAIVGSHASRCKILSGDTLSKDALAVYGDWHLYSTTLMGANPNIVDANKIYAGAWIVIPDAVAPTAKTEVAVEKIFPTMKTSMMPTSEEITAALSMEDDPSTLSLREVFANMPVPIVRFDTASPQITATSIIQPSSPTGTRTTDAKPAEISGYKLTIPQSVFVAMGGIPLKRPLKTEILRYPSRDAKGHNAPNGYSHLKDSWAQQEGKNIVLYVPKGIPTKPFNLFIAGIRDPIDGEMFMANAETFHGKFPGPHKVGGRIFSALMLSANGYMLASTLGPIAGSSVLCGMLVTREILKHHAESSLKKAEDNYNATLAEGQTPSGKESGQ